MNTLLNLGFFQCTWLAAVFGAAHGRVWPGALALLASIAVQSAPWTPVRMPARELLASAAAIGLGVDSALVMTDSISFPEAARNGWPPPAWMSVLWINFATTLDESLAWAGERKIAAALAGAVGGPLAYLAGQGAGAIRLDFRPESILPVACLWALAFPALAALAKLRRSRSAQSTQPAHAGRIL